MSQLVLRVAVAAAVVTLLAGAVSAFLASSPSGARPGWTIRDLDLDVEVSALDDRGQIAAVDLGVGKPFLLEAGRAVYLLGPGDHGVANALNDRGQAVGWHEAVSRSEQAAFLWQQGKLVQLEFDGVNDASGINDSGQVVGTSAHWFNQEGNDAPSCPREPVYGGMDAPQAWLWRGGRRTGLGGLGGGESAASAINGRGQVVGWSKTAAGTWHAFLWQRGKMTDLGTLPGGQSSCASAINDRGQVVGVSTASSGTTRAFLWQEGRMRDLGVLPGRTSSAASGINERGQVVGSSDGPGHGSAFIWENGTISALGSLRRGGASSAVDINDRGQIVGSATTTAGGVHAVLWTFRSG